MSQAASRRPSVLLADDHMIVAEGIGLLISQVADLVGRVSNGIELVDAARRLRPDVVVSDVTMPGLGGLDALRQLKAEHVPSRFIFLTIHKEPRLAAEAMRAGAFGYVLKQSAGEELVAAIRAVTEGGTYLTPLIARDVLWTMASADVDGPSLTPRQLQVLRHIAEGHRMKEIAASLGISVRTVEDYKAQLLAVLHAGSTADLVRFAVRRGLVAD